MVTFHYTGKKNKSKVIAVFHRAGNVTVEGVVRRDERYLWTHKPAKGMECCENGTIPAYIRRGDNE